MNLSGEPTGAVARFYKVPPEETLVIFDDVALPLEKLRFRPGGSAGGHNGMRSVIEHLGTANVPRLRVGIGNAIQPGLTSHVLGRFTADEMPVVSSSIKRAAEAVQFASANGLQAAMNTFNS